MTGPNEQDTRRKVREDTEAVRAALDEVARFFGQRPHNAGRGRVYRCSVSPLDIVAILRSHRNGSEPEYVVDTRWIDGADIRELED